MIRDMPERGLMKVRSLPNGDFHDMQETGWDGNMLHLAFSGDGMGFSRGVLVEIQGESQLYLGEVRHCSGGAIKVLVEHALDSARLAAMQDTWR